MASVDEPYERLRSAVRLVHGVLPDAVVSPAPAPREVSDGHHFHSVDAQLDEVVQLADGRVEGALVGERADVQLVQHAAAEIDAFPLWAVDGCGVDDAAGTMRTVRLGETARIRAG